MHAATLMKDEVPIRAVSRSLAVLKLINAHGQLSMTEISRLSQLPYPTTSRIVQTLVHEGMIQCDLGRKRYYPTELVKTLSASYVDHGDIRDVARPYLMELTRQHNWPFMITNQVGHSVQIQDSTYGETSTSFNCYPSGYRLPLLGCAAGHAYLAFVEDDVRDCLLRGLERLGTQHHALGRFCHGDYAQSIRRCGFAAYERSMYTANPGKTSAIAVPLVRDGGRLAQLSISYISSAMSMAEAVKRYAEPLMIHAARIESHFRKDTWPDRLSNIA
ncbi:helix-turn-helix domain-containing protein [Pseudomonas silvicola]|nr:helix-turn-helix domain-containing protein [Pseudomonas silvicola]